MRNSYFVSRVAIGVVLMTVSFFLTLGLLQRFDLSYLYPFQGLSVIFITILAAVVLKEKLSARLTIGALLITAGHRARFDELNCDATASVAPELAGDALALQRSG